MHRINPSILSADFVNMQRDLESIATADFVHVDVMDNHFVPNLSFGPQMVQRILDVSPIPLDVHLMIDRVDEYGLVYAEMGCASVTFHVEAADDPVVLARALRARGARAGLAIKPGTPVEPYLDILNEFDQFLVMTVEPGFGGQSFIDAVMPKLDALRHEASRIDSDIWLQVDGGITLDTIVIAAEHGADTFVAGSSVFNGGDPENAIGRLRRAVDGHSRSSS
jgi:ribulose-phosphate 3-epimerase